MSARALQVVLGTLGGLVLVYGLVLLAGSMEAPASEAETALAEVLAAVGRDSVEAIEIVGGEGLVTIRRAPEGWTVSGFPADTLAIRRVLDALAVSSIGSLISSNPENHDRLGVTGEAALQLSVTGTGGGAVTLTVGDAGPGTSSTYVRLPDSNDVFLLRTALRTAAARGAVGSWRDRRVVRVDTAAVARLAVERDGAWTEMVRADAGWTVDGAPAVALPVRDLLGGLSSLIAIGFAPDSVTLDTVTRRVVAIGAEGDTLAAIEMGEGSTGGQIPTRTPGVDGILELSEFQADRITPTRERVTGES